jgi:hypothetical protein
MAMISYYLSYETIPESIHSLHQTSSASAVDIKYVQLRLSLTVWAEIFKSPLALRESAA